MSDRSCEISSYTGETLKDKLSRLTKDKDNWKGGKWHKFYYKHGELEVLLFQIKACIKILSIEEAIKFESNQLPISLSWDNSVQEILSDDSFGSYFNRFLSNKIHTLDDDVTNKRDMFKCCIMLIFEIARWSLQDCDPEKAISIVLNQSDREDSSNDISDLCKIFPKGSTKNEEDKRKIAWRAIMRRDTEKELEDINKWWPAGERDEDLLEMLTGDALERKYAFKKFRARKKERNEILLRQEKTILEFFKTVVTTIDEEDAERAFEQMDKRLGEDEEE